MARSIYTNTIIKEVFERGYLVKIHDGEEATKAKNFKEAAALIDDLDDATIIVYGQDKKRVGFIFLVMENDGEEQLSDYAAVPEIEDIVKAVDAKAAKAENNFTY